VSVEFRTGHPEVPWRRIIDFRHRLVHGYAELDYVLVWEVVTRMVPELRDQVVEMLRQLE
jgi:uncharacterized protein with HEPN domain